jgi:hypothetical protein
MQQMGQQLTYKTVLEKPQTQIPLGKCRRIWEDNVYMNLLKQSAQISTVQDEVPIRSFCERGHKSFDFIEADTFLDS